MGEERKSLYDLIKEKIERGEDVGNELFRTGGEDEYRFIDSLTKGLKQAIKERDLDAKTLNSLSVLLLGVSRFPLPTPGINLNVEASAKGDGGGESFVIHITPDEFNLSHGGYIMSFGADGFTNFDLQSGKGYYVIDPSGYELMDSNEVMRGLLMSGEFWIDNCTDYDKLEWDQNDPWIFWEWNENHPIEN